MSKLPSSKLRKGISIWKYDNPNQTQADWLFVGRQRGMLVFKLLSSANPTAPEIMYKHARRFNEMVNNPFLSNRVTILY